MCKWSYLSHYPVFIGVFYAFVARDDSELDALVVKSSVFHSISDHDLLIAAIGVQALSDLGEGEGVVREGRER